jgi:hypothetical protein
MTGIRAQAVDRAGRILDRFTMDVDGRDPPTRVTFL